MDDADITALARRARAGDDNAAALFVRATQADVRRLVSHLAGRDHADDLTQETYLRAIRALPRFRGDAHARLWLLAVARRVAADHIRQTQRRRRGPDSHTLHAPTASDPADGVVLRHLIAQLDPDRRIAFVLTQILGLTYQQAAAISGCPVGTIRSRVARARDDLIHALDSPHRDHHRQQAQ
jgi:RNA polymerase sigma-70 factor, ECF subfamily